MHHFKYTTTLNAALRIYNERLEAGTAQPPDLPSTDTADLQAPIPADGAILVSAAASSTMCPPENSSGAGASATAASCSELVMSIAPNSACAPASSAPCSAIVMSVAPIIACAYQSSDQNMQLAIIPKQDIPTAKVGKLNDELIQLLRTERDTYLN